jgi:hypothetical protein
MNWKKLFFIWLSWSLVFGLLAIFADHFLPYAPSFPYFDAVLPKFDWPRWIYSWANFDGVHYLTIAERGYKGIGLIQAFFPVWPGLVTIFSQITGLDLLLSGLLLSHVFSFTAVLLLWTYLKTTLGPKTANWGLVWWLLTPTAFFTLAFYNEGLFVSLAIGSILAAKKNRWWLAGLLASIAAATRVVGIFLVLALAAELIQQTHFTWSYAWIKKNFSKMIAITIGTVGLLLYMVYLWLEFHDPVYFLHVQSAFGAGRQTSLVIWPQVVWRGLMILFTARPFDWKYLTYVQEFIAGVGSVAIVLWGWWHRKKTQLTTPLALYSLSCLLLPTLTGTFSSMPRYILAAWPLWIAVAYWSQKNPKWALLALAFSVGLLIINTVLFVQGYWIA